MYEFVRIYEYGKNYLFKKKSNLFSITILSYILYNTNMNKYIKDLLSVLKNKKDAGISSSFLIYGEKDIDKLFLAKKMASMFLEKPAGELKKSPDYYFLNSKNSIKIGEIRNLIKKLTLTSYYNYKVIIINNSHLLTQEASNSLLKLIEEPDKNTVFILVTDQIMSILPTIRSRCLEIYNGVEKKNEIYRQALKKYDDSILAKELSEISIGRNQILNKIKTKKDLNELKGKYKEILNQVFLNDIDEAFLWASGFSKNKKKVFEVLEIAQVFLKDLIMIKNNFDPEYMFLKTDYLRILKNTSKTKLIEIIKKSLDYYKILEYNISEKLILENIILTTKNYE